MHLHAPDQKLQKFALWSTGYINAVRVWGNKNDTFVILFPCIFGVFLPKPNKNYKRPYIKYTYISYPELNIIGRVWICTSHLEYTFTLWSMHAEMLVSTPLNVQESPSPPPAPVKSKMR